VSSKEGTFFEESGHDSREKIFVNFWSKYFSAVGGRTVRIRTIRTIPYNHTDLAQKSRQFLARFSRQFSDFRWLFLGCMEQSVHGLWAWKTRYGRGGTAVRFGTENEADFCGTDLVL
jgi:hypothetical protein